MHGVIAGERQAGQYDLRLPVRHDAVRRQGVTDDLVVLLGIETVFVDADAGAAGRPLRHPVAETLDPIGMAVALGVFERHQEAAGRRLVVMIIAATPSVDIERAVGTEHHLAGVAEIVGENGCAEAGRQRDAASVGSAGISSRPGLILLCNGCRSAGEQRSDDKTRCTKESHGAPAPLDVMRHIKRRAVSHDDAPSSESRVRGLQWRAAFPTRAHANKRLLSQS